MEVKVAFQDLSMVVFTLELVMPTMVSILGIGIDAAMSSETIVPVVIVVAKMAVLVDAGMGAMILWQRPRRMLKGRRPVLRAQWRLRQMWRWQHNSSRSRQRNYRLLKPLRQDNLMLLHQRLGRKKRKMWKR
jgi:hypothetical protein